MQAVTRRKPDFIPTMRLSALAPAVARLRGFGLPAKRLAELFDTNVGYINVLTHRERARRSGSQGEPARHGRRTVASYSIPEALEAKQALRIRAEEDGIELTPRRIRNLEWLESQMQEIAEAGRSSYKFLEAIGRLRALKSLIGYPAQSGLLKFAAKLHQHLAWFYTHSGLASSCLMEADYSIRLYEIVYHNTGDKDALRELGGSCLIRSNSRLSHGDGKEALGSLGLSREATLSADLALNSEYYHQQGVALLQMRQDGAARKMFERVRRTTPDSDVKDFAMLLRMSCDRPLNLLSTPFANMEGALELLSEAKAAYGPDSLEAIMCAHWAAACGLSTDSPSAQLLALDLIQANQNRLSRFGHQATISKLLPIALELSPNKRPHWVRFALYQNAFHNN